MVFMSKILVGALPVADKILARGIRIDGRCQTCGLEGESNNHLLFTCTLARQVWALSNVPTPENGFAESVFTNVSFLHEISGLDKVPFEIRRSIPWILWMIWKNRNNLIFEAKVFKATYIMEKVREDAAQWFQNQSLQHRDLQGVNQTSTKQKEIQNRLDSSWQKCNIGACWNKVDQSCGAAWVLRNDRGEVMMHGRRSFVQIYSHLEAHFESVRWAIESMDNLKMCRVVFAFEAVELIGAITRPPAWPSFKFYSNSLLQSLDKLQSWKLSPEAHGVNKEAYFIAKSVGQLDLWQSYIALGPLDG